MARKKPMDWTMTRTLASMAQYLNVLAKTGKNKPNTITTKRNTLSRFAEFCPPEPDRIRTKHVQAFLNSVPSPGGKRADLTRIRPYIKWAMKQGHITRDPADADDLMLPTVEDASNFRARSLPTPMAQAVVDAATVKPRRLLMTLMMIQEGARGAEVAASCIEHWDTSTGMVALHGKRGKIRDVLASEETLNAFHAYLKARGGNKLRGPLFTDERANYPNKGICQQTVYREVIQAFRDAGIKDPKIANQRVLDGMTPHTLRHTALTRRADKGCPLNTLQEIAGHENPETTKRYIKGALIDQQPWTNAVRYLPES